MRVADMQRAANAAPSFGLPPSDLASRAPWLAYGLRRLRAQLTYMKTYGADAGAFGVFYCARRVGWIDTRWDDKISLIATTAFDLPPCESLSLVSGKQPKIGRTQKDLGRDHNHNRTRNSNASLSQGLPSSCKPEPRKPATITVGEYYFVGKKLHLRPPRYTLFRNVQAAV